MTKKSRVFLNGKTKNTRHTSVIPPQYLVRLTYTCKAVQTRLRDVQDIWLSETFDGIQFFADRKDTKKFFDERKTIYGPQSSGIHQRFSADGTSLLTYKEAVLKRRTDHFNGVLYLPLSINDKAINRLKQMECNLLLHEFPSLKHWKQ